MDHRKTRFGLKRSLGFWELVLYGLGVILGAGIYALIGAGAGVAGNAVWLSFALAACIAAFTGLSYAELSSMFPRAAAEYNYTKRAFGRRCFSFVIGWIMIAASVVSVATVALGFSGYFTHMFGGNPTLIACGLIGLLSIVNFKGIKESSKFNMISTLIEGSGLVIVVLAGAYFFFSSGIAVDLFETPGNGGVFSIVSATVLIFFAYIGYENIVNISEEARDARRMVPKALLISIAVSTVLYILVSLSVVNILGWERLSASSAPLTEAVSAVVPDSDFLFSLIALFATANTVLILLIVSSRVLYGMSSDGTLPGLFRRVGKRGTPHFSVLAVCLAALAVAALGSIKTVAMITDMSLFIVYISVNASAIALRYRMPDARRAFRAPLNIGRFPVLAFCGAVSSIFMLFYFQKEIVFIEIVLVVSGLVIYSMLHRGERKFACFRKHLWKK